MKRSLYPLLVANFLLCASSFPFFRHHLVMNYAPEWSLPINGIFYFSLVIFMFTWSRYIVELVRTERHTKNTYTNTYRVFLCEKLATGSKLTVSRVLRTIRGSSSLDEPQTIIVPEKWKEIPTYVDLYWSNNTIHAKSTKKVKK